MLSRDVLDQPSARQTFSDRRPQVESIRQRFLDRLPDRYTQITKFCHALDDGTGGAEAINGIAERAHKIAGVADTLGYPELGARAAAVDASLTDLRRMVDWENVRLAVYTLIDEIGQTIRQSA